MEEMPGNALKPIVLKTPIGFDYFDYHEIIMIKAKGNCYLVFTVDRDSPVRVLHNLGFIEKKYCNKTLYRCHKSFVINLNYVEKIVIKNRLVYLKKNLIVPLSEHSLRIIRQMSIFGHQK